MTNRDTKHPTTRYGRSRRFLPRFAALAVALTLPLAGCSIDDLLEVDDPDVARPDALTSKEALPAILAGAVGDFQVALGGNSGGNPAGVGAEGQINLTGLFTDELLNTESFPTRIEVDTRQVEIDNATTQGIYRALTRARASAEFAVRRFEEFDPNTAGHAEALSLAGFSYVLFAENYCSGVAFSTLTDAGAIEYGSPQTTQQMFETAIARFDAALAAASAAGEPDLENLAKVGKGRALLGLGRFADAETAVAGVPTSFVYLSEHSSNSGRQENGIFAFVQIAERWGVSDVEGINGMPFRSANDPRVPFERTPANDLGFDNSTPIFDQLKYPDRDADVVAASGLEARLIEAEADLAAGQAGDALTKLNDLRASPPAYATLEGGTLAPLGGPATVDLLFQERAFWLYLTSHRLGDLRRLVRHYSRGAETVFPTGAYERPLVGGAYGTDVNLPIPVDEANNPNVAKDAGGLPQCLDRLA